MSYDARTEAVLTHEIIATFTPADFVRLALAALDQANVTPERLARAWHYGMRKRGTTENVLDELDLPNDAVIR